jgi:hypothetical protein
MSDTPDEAARGVRPSVPPDRRKEGVRYLPATLEPTSIRAEDDGDPTTIYGHFGVFNRWTEIDSLWEGHFLERFAPGSFKRTIREARRRCGSCFSTAWTPASATARSRTSTPAPRNSRRRTSARTMRRRFSAASRSRRLRPRGRGVRRVAPVPRAA